MGLGLFLGGLVVGSLLFGGGGEGDTYVIHNGSTTKEWFFDKYREVDVTLSRMVGESSGGFGLLISAFKYQGRSDAQARQVASIMMEIRNYRNSLAHNRNRWRDISNPSQQMCQVLSWLAEQVYVDSDSFRLLVAQSKRYLDSIRY